jgi:Family of unknown function (DUF6159)
MGRVARSWDMVSQSFAVLRSDKELVLLPIVSALFNLSVSVLILGTTALFFRPAIQSLLAMRISRPTIPQTMWLFLFLFYLANYFIVIFFNVVLVSIASDRLAGGHATLNDGLQIAWERKGSIFQWAFLAATVGILLRALEDRMGWLGRMIVGWIGIAWSLATYFVVPILAAENISPVEALQRSAGIFTETWGEELAGGFSFGLIFFLLAIPGMALIFLGTRQGGPAAIAGVVVAVLYWLLLGVVSSAVQGIFVAALYRYATTKQVPPGFSQDAFRDAWRSKA